MERRTTMPNWVYNSLVIMDKPEVIAKMREQLSAPYEVQEYDWATKESKFVTVNEPFSFWNIIKPTNLAEYWDYADTTQRHPDHWYAWNCRNWGVKWEVRDLEDQTEEEGKHEQMVFFFATAWGVPNEALRELSRQYPTAAIELEFEEETGWGGEHHYLNGVEHIISEYNFQCNDCGLQWGGDPSELTFDEDDDGQHDCKADKDKWQRTKEKTNA
jgi:hypothetical protein